MKKFQHNTSEPGLLKEDKRNSFTLPLPSSPKVAHLGAQKDSPGMWFHPLGERELKSECLASPAVCVSVRDPFLFHSIQSPEL